MKHIFTILLILKNLLIFSQTKTLEVKYKIMLRDDGIYEDYIKEKPNSYYLFENIDEYSELFEMRLIADKNLSFYRVLEVIEPLNPLPSFKNLKSTVNYDKFYYFKQKEQILYEQYYFQNKEVLVRTTQDNYEWTITDETKMIQGFNCHKAILKFKDRKPEFIAWFTPEIPFGSGPTEFVGLPGLILELRTPFYVYGATYINLNSDEKPYKLPDLPILEYEYVEEQARKALQNFGM